MRIPYLQLLSGVPQLRAAWEIVRDKKAAGGIDAVSVADFAARADAELPQLSAELRAATYLPEAYLALEIDKKDKPGETRTLGLSTVRDKVVQQAIRALIEPKLDALFLDTSYAYRPGKGTKKAVGRVRHLIAHEKRTWLVKADIDSYFDTIDHGLLHAMLRTEFADDDLSHLIGMFIAMGRTGPDAEWREVSQGVPQGNILSPLLSNLYLHPFDQFVAERGWGYVRYADDFVLLLRTRAEAERALAETQGFLRDRLRLQLNSDPRVASVDDGFTYLGLWFEGNRVRVREKKLRKLCESVAEVPPLERGNLARGYLQSLNSTRAYYGATLPAHQLEELDEAMIEGLVRFLRRTLAEKKLARPLLTAEWLAEIDFFTESRRTEAVRQRQEIARMARARKDPFDLPFAPDKADPAARRKIALRRRQYRERAAEVKELVVATHGAFIGKTRNRVVVRLRGKNVRSIPLKQLDNITVVSQGVGLSSDVLKYCAKHGIAIDLLDRKGMPYTQVMPAESVSARVGLAQLRAYDNGQGAKLARLLVDAKLRNQRNLVKYFAKYHRKSDTEWQQDVTSKLAAMEKARAEAAALPDAPLSELRLALMAAEGRAATAYWAYLRDLLAERVDFAGRERQGASDPVNSALNYGYGILYGRVWEAVARARLQPGLSYLHAPDERKPSLTFDLIEEFRAQAVDRAVCAMIRKGTVPRVNSKGLLHDESRKAVAAAVIERLGRHERFRGRSMRLMDILLGQAKAVRAYLTGEADRYRPYIGKW